MFKQNHVRLTESNYRGFQVFNAPVKCLPQLIAELETACMEQSEDFTSILSNLPVVLPLIVVL